LSEELSYHLRRLGLQLLMWLFLLRIATSTAAKDFPGILCLEENVLPCASSGVDRWLLLCSDSSLAWLQPL
jgi:hypothetical protein